MKEKIKDQFKKRHTGFEQSANWIVSPELLAEHFEGVTLDKQMSGLDVCCGTGIVGEYLKKSIGHVTGVDISEDMLEIASKKLDKVICSNAVNLPLPDKSFDIVVMRQALHFTETWPDIINELFRVVKDDGVVIVSQIVPFNDPIDADYLHKIHRAKQPLLISFVTEQGLDEAFTVQTNCFDKKEMFVEESINMWLKYTPELTDAQRNETINLFKNAPEEYKNYHRVRITEDDVYDTMRWVIYQAKKD